MKYTELDELVDSLRETLDYFENNPKAIELPSFYQIHISASVYEYAKNPVTGVEDYSKQDDFLTRLKMRKIAKAMMPCDKDYSGMNFSLTRKFGKKVKLTITTTRDAICERKVISTKVIPARTETFPERVEEEVEWVCNDSLLASPSQQ